MLRWATLLLSCAIGWPAHVYAAPIQWPAASGGNNHYYDIVIAGAQTWPQAKADAQSRIFQGAHGYLMTITSQAESDFLAANLITNRYWMGGYQDLSAPDYSEPSGGWRWVTGEPFVYSNWNAGEPNNDQGDERYMEETGFPGAVWNDLPPNFQHGAYYIEYAAVPEPSTGVMAGIACSMLCLLRKRLRQR